MNLRRWLRPAEVAAWTIAMLCGGGLLFNRVEAGAAQRAAAAMQGHPVSRNHAVLRSAAWKPPVPADLRPRLGTAPGQILGRLEIPALHLTTPIVEGYDARALTLGAGHISGTALPGGLGNFAVAAHRDTFFRPLSGIRPGMKIRVVTSDDTFVYIVDSTRIVRPEDVDVLDMGDVPQMTLITCYPFHYIGAAPKRFTVLAHLASF